MGKIGTLAKIIAELVIAGAFVLCPGCGGGGGSSGGGSTPTNPPAQNQNTKKWDIETVVHLIENYELKERIEDGDNLDFLTDGTYNPYELFPDNCMEIDLDTYVLNFYYDEGYPYLIGDDYVWSQYIDESTATYIINAAEEHVGNDD